MYYCAGAVLDGEAGFVLLAAIAACLAGVLRTFGSGRSWRTVATAAVSAGLGGALCSYGSLTIAGVVLLCASSAAGAAAIAGRARPAFEKGACWADVVLAGLVSVAVGVTWLWSEVDEEIAGFVVVEAVVFLAVGGALAWLRARRDRAALSTALLYVSIVFSESVSERWVNLLLTPERLTKDEKFIVACNSFATFAAVAAILSVVVYAVLAKRADRLAGGSGVVA